MQRPLCEGKDPEIWFDPERFHEAIMLCRQCPLQEKCAELGETAEYGVWGSTTPYERGWRHEEDGSEETTGWPNI